MDPALKGTRAVMHAAARAGTVKRIVLTSSMAAITDEPDSEHVLTEADWNQHSSLERNPYYYSKTLAEKEAWRIVNEGIDGKKPGYDLVVINPFLVVGPALTAALNPSNQVFADMLKGTYPGIMRIAWGFVDVRDVALAHVLALETEKAQGRYICANVTVGMREVVEILQAAGYGHYKLPKIGLDCAAGDFVVTLSSYFQPKGVGSYLRTHIGRTPNFDNSKIQRELGLRFRPVKDSIHDSITDLLKWGHGK
jgi:dihydroflavonol-4-reductase